MTSDLFFGLGLGVFVATIAYIFYKQWSVRQKSTTFYYDNVVAYKVGLIRGEAEKNNVTLVFPPHVDDLIDSIKEEVDHNLKSPNSV